MTDPLDALHTRFAGLRPAGQSPAAQVLVGADGAGAPVTVVVLTAAGAADPAVRAALVRAAGRSAYGPQSGDLELHAADLSGPRPWVASRQAPGRPGVEELLPLLPDPAGPVPAEPVPAAAGPGPTRDDGGDVDPSGGAPAGADSIGGAPAGAVGHDPTPNRAPGGAGAPAPAGVPAGGDWQPTPPRRSPWAVAALAVAGLLLLLVCGVGMAVVANQLGDGPTVGLPTPAGPAAGGGTGPAPADPTAPAPGGPPGAGPAPSPAANLFAPTFGPADDTYLMSFPGWPFAFRTPASWGCLAGRIDLPDAEARVCVDERDPAAGQRVHVMLRPCPTSCTRSERREMDEAWFDQPARALAGVDDRTTYVETGRDGADRYTVDLSRYFAERPGGPLRWQVGVYLESPGETREQVQKILNDIVARTP